MHLHSPNIYDKSAKFWAKIFALNFAFGVVTGIPMEFQFGTNWAKFSAFAGGVIGQTLAMEGVFAFFLESSFLGLFIFGEKKLGRTGHLISAILVFIGSWISGFFIVATNAWMQVPVGFEKAADGSFQLEPRYFNDKSMVVLGIFSYDDRRCSYCCLCYGFTGSILCSFKQTY